MLSIIHNIHWIKFSPSIHKTELILFYSFCYDPIRTVVTLTALIRLRMHIAIRYVLVTFDINYFMTTITKKKDYIMNNQLQKILSPVKEWDSAVILYENMFDNQIYLFTLFKHLLSVCNELKSSYDTEFLIKCALSLFRRIAIFLESLYRPKYKYNLSKLPKLTLILRHNLNLRLLTKFSTSSLKGQTW